MSFLSVILAAVANFAFGAIWYMSLAKPWMAASGVEVGEDGRPANNADPTPYITSVVAAVLVAGMIRHVFCTERYRQLWQRSTGRVRYWFIFSHAVDCDLLWIWRKTTKLTFDRWRLCHDWVHRHGCRSNATLKTEGFR